MTTMIAPARENVHYLPRSIGDKMTRKQYKVSASLVVCNICGKSFFKHSRFGSFCLSCKAENEHYFYSVGY